MTNSPRVVHSRVRLSAPLNVVLESTWACNYKCIYCSNAHLRKKPAKPTNFDYQRLIEELAKKEVFYCSISGGEPYLDKPLLFNLIDLLKKADIKPAINTNGSLIAEEDIPLIKGITHFVSFPGFDSFEKITGAPFKQRVLDNIDLLRRNGIKVEVNFVANKLNIDEFERVYSFFKKRGVPVFLSRMRCAINCGTTYSSLEDRITVKKIIRCYDRHEDVLSASDIPYCALNSERSLPLSNRCGAAVICCTIGANGRVRPCVASDVEGPNVFEIGFERAWRSLDPWIHTFKLPRECEDCVYTAECLGGCRTAAKAVFGSYNAKDPMMTKPFKRRVFKELSVNFGNKSLYKNSLVRLRKEEFGWLFLLKKGSAIPVNEEAKKLFDDCVGRNVKELSSITKARYGLNEKQAKETILPLLTTFVLGGYCELR